MNDRDLQHIVDRVQRGLVHARPGPQAGTWQAETPPDLRVLFRSTGSGLLVPQSTLLRRGPIAQVKTYLTASEVFGVRPDPDAVERMLKQVPLGAALLFAGDIMATLRHPRRSQRDTDLAYAKDWFREPTLTKVRNLIGTDESRILIPPQAVHVMIKLALLFSPNGPTNSTLGELPAILLAISELMGNVDPENTDPLVIDTTPGWLGRELVANQYLNDSLNVVSMMARSYHRWVANSDLATIYRNVTGVDINDLMTVSLALWAHWINADEDEDSVTLYPTVKLAELNWDASRIEKTLALFVAPLDQLTQYVQEDIEQYGVKWSNSPIERFPVMPVSDELFLILDPNMLVRRAFGWLPYWDVISATKNRKIQGRFANRITKISEQYVEQALMGICGDASRFYSESRLKASLGGTGRRVADAAIDYGDAWVVLETTTTQLRRGAVAGVEDDSVDKDLNKMVDEVEQISDTIDSLRNNGTRLTGFKDHGPRRFYPVLIMAEGFPINPVTLTVLRGMVEKKGLLRGADTAPLEVLDTDELDMIEGLAQSDGPTFIELLRGKATAEMWRASMEHYIMVELGLNPPKPARVTRLWNETVNHLSRRLLAASTVDAGTTHSFSNDIAGGPAAATEGIQVDKR